MRGTRHQQKCGTCGLPGESFPHGYYQPPLCESCIRAVKLNAWALAPWSDCQNQLANWTQEWNVQPADVVVCRACGCGDNTIGHWTRWCVVPLIVAIAILQPNEKETTLDQLAGVGSREAIVCTLVLASFRRLLRQEGAFLHQQAATAFFLLYAAWVRSRAERPSVSYSKVVMEVAWTGHNLQFTKTN